MSDSKLERAVSMLSAMAVMADNMRPSITSAVSHVTEPYVYHKRGSAGKTKNRAKAKAARRARKS